MEVFKFSVSLTLQKLNGVFFSFFIFSSVFLQVQANLLIIIKPSSISEN